MAATPPPNYTPFTGLAPQRNDRTTFSSRVDAFVTWFITAIGQAAALVANAYNNALAAAGSADAADLSRAKAEAAATAAANAADAQPFNAATNYTQYACAISLLDFLTYRRVVAGVGATDPSLDSVNWVSLTPKAKNRWAAALTF